MVSVVVPVTEVKQVGDHPVFINHADSVNIINDRECVPKDENGLDRYIKMITRLNPKATIIPNDNTYDIELNLDSYDSNEFKDVNIKINSLLSNKKCDLSKIMFFAKWSVIHVAKWLSLPSKIVFLNEYLWKRALVQEIVVPLQIEMSSYEDTLINIDYTDKNKNF